MTIEFPQAYDISPLDQEKAACDFTDLLASAETLSSCTLTSTGTTGLTLGTPSVNSSIETIYGRQVAIGKAILFNVSGQTVNNSYKIRVQVTTSVSRVLNRLALLACR